MQYIPVLAEVSDKMMPVSILSFLAASIVVVAWALIRKSRWFSIFPIAFAAFLAISSLEELNDPYVGPAIIHELGYGYVSLSYLPLVGVMVLLLIKKKEAKPGV